MKATELGLNPYLPNNIGGVMEARGRPDPYDPRAKGMDGDLLDAMCKGRWTEGHTAGVTDGHQAASSRYVDVYDEGFERGHSHGTDETRARQLNVVIPLLRSLDATLADIYNRTSSRRVKDMCEAQRMAIEVEGHNLGVGGLRPVPDEQAE